MQHVWVLRAVTTTSFEVFDANGGANIGSAGRSSVGSTAMGEVVRAAQKHVPPLRITALAPFGNELMIVLDPAPPAPAPT